MSEEKYALSCLATYFTKQFTVQQYLFVYMYELFRHTSVHMLCNTKLTVIGLFLITKYTVTLQPTFSKYYMYRVLTLQYYIYMRDTIISL